MAASSLKRCVHMRVLSSGFLEIGHRVLVGIGFPVAPPFQSSLFGDRVRVPLARTTATALRCWCLFRCNGTALKPRINLRLFVPRPGIGSGELTGWKFYFWVFDPVGEGRSVFNNAFAFKVFVAPPHVGPPD